MARLSLKVLLCSTTPSLRRVNGVTAKVNVISCSAMSDSSQIQYGRHIDFPAIFDAAQPGFYSWQYLILSSYSTQRSPFNASRSDDMEPGPHGWEPVWWIYGLNHRFLQQKCNCSLRLAFKGFGHKSQMVTNRWACRFRANDFSSVGLWAAGRTVYFWLQKLKCLSYFKCLTSR